MEVRNMLSGIKLIIKKKKFESRLVHAFVLFL